MCMDCPDYATVALPPFPAMTSTLTMTLVRPQNMCMSWLGHCDPSNITVEKLYKTNTENTFKQVTLL